MESKKGESKRRDDTDEGKIGRNEGKKEGRNYRGREKGGVDRKTDERKRREEGIRHITNKKKKERMPGEERGESHTRLTRKKSRKLIYKTLDVSHKNKK